RIRPATQNRWRRLGLQSLALANLGLLSGLFHLIITPVGNGVCLLASRDNRLNSFTADNSYRKNCCRWDFLCSIIYGLLWAAHWEASPASGLQVWWRHDLAKHFPLAR